MSDKISPFNEIKADIDVAKYFVSAEGNLSNDEAKLNIATYYNRQ